MKTRIYIALLLLVLGCTASAQSTDSIYRLRILVAYTDAAMNGLGGMQPASEAMIDAISDLNLACENSRVGHQWDLARLVGIDFEESEDFYDNVWRFSRLDYVETLRAKYKADVAVLVMDNPSMCGLPLVLDHVAERNTAYCGVHWECMQGAYGLAHMVGHLYGAAHPPDIDFDTPSDDALYTYGHGYSWVYLDSDCGFLTIMGYDDKSSCGQDGDYNCNVIPYFSNPDVRYSGVPTGIEDLCDNARVLRENAPQLAFNPLVSTWNVSDTVRNADYALLQGLDVVYSGNHYRIEDSATVFFRASTRITLEPGFETDEGIYFETLLDSLLLLER